MKVRGEVKPCIRPKAWGGLEGKKKSRGKIQSPREERKKSSIKLERNIMGEAIQEGRT